METGPAPVIKTYSDVSEIATLLKNMVKDLVKDGKVRIGTIQAFKGLEADVVIRCGLDGKLPGCSPANLYVGATRARAMLQVIRQKDFVI